MPYFRFIRVMVAGMDMITLSEAGLELPLLPLFAVRIVAIIVGRFIIIFDSALAWSSRSHGFKIKGCLSSSSPQATLHIYLGVFLCRSSTPVNTKSLSIKRSADSPL
jgi:hypothetical protein